MLEERIKQQSRRAVDLALQRHRDQLLDLLGGKPRHLGRDLRRDVAELRVRFDRQGFPRVDPESAEQHREHHDRDAPVQAKADELINH